MNSAIELKEAGKMHTERSLEKTNPQKLDDNYNDSISNQNFNNKEKGQKNYILKRFMISEKNDKIKLEPKIITKVMG